MKQRRSGALLTLALVVVPLAGCGGGSGGGGGIAATPPPPPSAGPTPSPPPPPPAFVPKAAKIFAEPLYNPELAVVGKGWQHEYARNVSGVSNLRDASGLTIQFDQTTLTYIITVPVAGSGTIMQTGAVTSFPFSYPSDLPAFNAEPADKSPTEYCCASLSVTTADSGQSKYRYVSLVDFFAPRSISANQETIAYGTMAVGQPTLPGEVPTTGSARYTGDLFGHFAGDAGATWLQGTASFDFDFGRAQLSGELRAGLRCMMGCSYDEVVYSFANTNLATGSASFSGELTTFGAPANGMFSGMFAGPGAAELMSRFQLPFYNPEYRTWMDAGGAIAAKRD